MGLLDSILGSVLGNTANSGGLQSILGSILSGSQNPGAQSPAAQSGGLGGLPNLVEQFNKAGLGSVIGSWIGGGSDQPVDPHSLGQVFGHDQVNQWAQQTGMSHDGILDSLSKILPRAVDHATPNGEIPSSPFDAPGIELPPGR